MALAGLELRPSKGKLVRIALCRDPDPRLVIIYYVREVVGQISTSPPRLTVGMRRTSLDVVSDVAAAKGISVEDMSRIKLVPHGHR